jgi:S1-C subfamily serine protease
VADPWRRTDAKGTHVSDFFESEDQQHSDDTSPDPSGFWPAPRFARAEGPDDPTGETPATPPDPMVSSGGPTPTSVATRPSSGVRLAVSTAMLAAAVLVGVGLGHLVWTSTITHDIQRFSFPGISLPGGPNGITFPNFPSGSGSGAQGSGGPSNAAAIEKKVNPALVDINATFNYQQASGEGTGIVLTANGEVLTNNHVIEGATSISVVDVGNGRTYAATVVGYDATHDVAVLQLTGATGLTTAAIGDSSSATVGESVLAIGNAGGVGGTPTSAGGAISMLNQSVQASDSLNGTNENLTGMIAVTASVQPGDSGGPLVDGSGKVLGIDTAGPAGSSFDFSTQTSGAAGYAIPVNEAVSIATTIESGTQTSSIHIGRTAFLGVLITTAGSGTSASGARVANVVGGGAAAQAGIVAGDVINSINGTTIGSTSSVAQALVPLHPGDSVTITWTTTSGHHVSASAVLQPGPSA